MQILLGILIGIWIVNSLLITIILTKIASGIDLTVTHEES